jgi:hypothetical protein
MNRFTRMLIMSGIGVGAAVAIGAGSAQAATTTVQAGTQGASAQAGGHWDDDDVVGYFGTRGACERVGHLGELRDRWDDYDCSRVRAGFNRGAWVLEVSNDDWNGSWDNDNWFGGWFNTWHGGDWHGGWNNGGWNHGGWDHGDHGDHGHGPFHH